MSIRVIWHERLKNDYDQRRRLKTSPVAARTKNPENPKNPKIIKSTKSKEKNCGEQKRNYFFIGPMSGMAAVVAFWFVPNANLHKSHVVLVGLLPFYIDIVKWKKRKISISFVENSAQEPAPEIAPI